MRTGPGATLARLRSPVVQDAAVAGVIGVVSLLSMGDPPPFVRFAFREPDALGVLLVVLACGGMVLRSIRPVLAVAGSLTASLALTQLGYSSGSVAVTALLAVYSVAARREPRVSVPVGVGAAVAVGVVLLTGPLDPTPGDWLSNLFVLATAWVLGRSVRVRRLHQADLAARNAAVQEAERAETRTLLSEERSRTAREVQDLVAHHLTEVSVQVAAARRLVGRDPEAAEAALLDAERVSRAAMEEMRRVAGMLGGTEPAALRPQPTLADVAELVADQRSAGGEVELRTEGVPGAVPAGVGLTAYRVVETAVTDARRHGADVPVRVLLRCEAGVLTVQVGSASEAPRIRWSEDGPSDGSVLHRLRIRVAAYGGELRWGPRRDGGFVVVARLPLSPVARTA